MRVHGTRAYIEPTPVPKMPAGLVELMEGLSREVLKNNPTEVYKFCAQHMRNLLVLRDGKPPEKYLTLEQKINKANNIIKRRADERRRNFDNNMRLHADKDIIEHSFGNDVEIASIVINADNLNTSKADSESREENIDTSKYNIEDINLDIGRNIKDIGHNTRDENVAEDKTETKNDLCTKDNVNENTSDTFADSRNQGNSTGFDKDDKTNTEPAVDDDNKEVVQELDINIENEINPIVVTANIEINDQPNVEVCEIAEECNVKEEKEIKLNEDPQGKSKEADQNNILNVQGTNEQNLAVDGDNIKENIVSPLDSLKDSIANNETENYDIKANLHVKYAAVKDINKDAEKNDSTDLLTKAGVTESPAKKVDIVVLEEKHDTNKETFEVIEKPQNQTNITKTAEKYTEFNNSNNTTENDATAKIIAENDVSENENLEQDINTLIKEDSDINKILIDQKDSDIVINVESEQQDKDNKNDANSNDDNSQLSMKEFDDNESNNSNEPETDKLKSPKTMDLETAAITIQKVFRNFLFRSKTSSLEEPTNIEFNMFGREPDSKDENGFMIHNQNKDRRVMGISRMDTVLQTVNEEKSLSLSTDDSSTISSAATVIQARIRGFLCRNRLNRNKMTSSASLNTSKDSSSVSPEADPDLLKNKTVLNIHIVPEGGQFVSRDESILTSMELSLDGSPPTSAKLHPLGYDKSERRKQLKREDAIQSISPPSNNSRLSEEQDSVKEVIVDEVKIGKAEKIDSEISVNSEHVSDKQEQVRDVLNSNDKIEAVNNVAVMEPPDSQITISNDDIFPNNGTKKNSSEEKLKDNKVSEEHELVNESSIEDKTEIEKGIGVNVPADSHENIPIHNDGEIVKDENKAEQKHVKEVLIGKEETEQNLESEQRVDSQKIVTTHDVDLKENAEDKAVTEISSDELDVVTPFTPTEENLNDSDKPRLLHSGEFHDVVLPTKVSRNDTSVVSGE